MDQAPLYQITCGTLCIEGYPVADLTDRAQADADLYSRMQDMVDQASAAHRLQSEVNGLALTVNLLKKALEPMARFGRGMRDNPRPADLPPVALIGYPGDPPLLQITALDCIEAARMVDEVAKPVAPKRIELPQGMRSDLLCYFRSDAVGAGCVIASKGGRSFLPHEIEPVMGFARDLANTLLDTTDARPMTDAEIADFVSQED